MAPRLLSWGLLLHCLVVYVIAADEEKYAERTASDEIMFSVVSAGTKFQSGTSVSKTAVICPEQYPKGFSVACKVSSAILKNNNLAFKLDGKVVRVERHEPFTIAGDGDSHSMIRPWKSYPRKGGKIVCVTSAGLYNSLDVSFSCSPKKETGSTTSPEVTNESPEASEEVRGTVEEELSPEPEASSEPSEEPSTGVPTGTRPTVLLPFSTVPVSSDYQVVRERPGLRYPSGLNTTG